MVPLESKIVTFDDLSTDEQRRYYHHADFLIERGYIATKDRRRLAMEIWKAEQKKND